MVETCGETSGGHFNHVEGEVCAGDVVDEVEAYEEVEIGCDEVVFFVGPNFVEQRTADVESGVWRSDAVEEHSRGESRGGISAAGFGGGGVDVVNVAVKVWYGGVGECVGDASEDVGGCEAVVAVQGTDDVAFSHAYAFVEGVVYAGVGFGDAADAAGMK